jgi:beta-galactosidase/beta-glucuronidase
MFYCISSQNAQQKPNSLLNYPRVSRIINSAWTFNYFPKETANKGYESPAIDDSRWSAISLPHTWNTFETTGEFEPYYVSTDEDDNTFWWIGWGWYRKHFSLNNTYAGRKVFIKFEGVQNYCKIWINGNYIGEHKGGHNAFCFDISGQVKYGEDNVVAVAVNNPPSKEIKLPLTLKDKSYLYGGIFRDVSLIIQNKLHIPIQGLSDQEGGTFITTPKVSERDGIVRIQTWVKNENTDKKNCTLRSTILDSSGNVVQVIKTDAVINAGQLFRFDQVGKPVPNPHLWSPENPYLYKIFSEVIDGKQILDECTSLFGFRKFKWNSKENLLYLYS